MAERIPERKEIPAADRWDLSPLFPGDGEWEELFVVVERDIARYGEFKGRLHESLSLIRSAIEFDLDLSRRLERLSTYAHLRSDEDKTNQHYLGLYQRVVSLHTRAAEMASFFTPEVQAIPDEVMGAYLSDQSMAGYRFYLEKILRYKPHTLAPAIEEILAMSGEMAQAPSQIFSQLDNADLRFGTLIDDRGREVELSHGNFSSFLLSSSRELRKKAFFQYYRSYDEHRNTIAASLAASNRKDSFYARVRSFESCRRASLFSDSVPDEVYDRLIASVKQNIEPLFTYLRFRKKILGLDELHFFDTYVPIVPDVPFHMPYDEAVSVCIDALAPLGDDYTATLAHGLRGGWVDRYENRGKRSGAYSSGCYDSPPYILMNYREDNINSLYTLIHEAGHSMHSHYSKAAQPYVSSDYTIFVAEVASTFNEILLSQHLLERYRDDLKMTAYILNREIDNIRATLFRQTMFAEFEARTHRLIEEYQPLTLDTLRIIYRELLSEYFGDTIIVDDELTLECLRIPHFYSAFYVYKYATGISAAIALAAGLLEERAGVREAYLRFLGLGGSMFPLDELMEAGVDMRSPQPVENAIAHFSRLVERLTKLF